MPNGREYESPLNKLADSLPGFILEMQRVKVRQDAYEALNTYRQGLLNEKIETNRISDLVQAENERLGRISAGQKEREDIYAARAKYGEAGARDIFPAAMQKHFPQGMAPEEEEEEKKPSAGTIAYARKKRDVFRKTISEIDLQIGQMQQTLGLAPGEKPKTPGGLGKKKEQKNLRNWEKLQTDRDKATASLDSLLTKAKERGIDLEFGAETPPTEDETPDPTGLMEGQTGTDSAGVQWIIEGGQWKESR